MASSDKTEHTTPDSNSEAAHVHSDGVRSASAPYVTCKMWPQPLVAEILHQKPGSHYNPQ